MLDSIEIALLARLYQNGSCRESKKTEGLLDRYQTARWVVRSRRKGEWILRSGALEDIKKRLEILLPTWQADFELLKSEGKSPLNPIDLDALPALRRRVPRKEFINRRNWKAITGAGPKHQQRRASPDVLTSDWILRIRPNQGLKAILGQKEIDLYEISEQWTECAIPERAWKKIRKFNGVLPDIIITCENLGAYIDFPEIPKMAVVFSPGKDIGPAILFLKMFSESKWIHFGDLDPEGINIALQISRRTGKPFSFFVPSFIDEYLDLSYRIKHSWRDPLPDIPIIEKLKEKGDGFYQECIMLDERLKGEIISFCGNVEALK